MNNCFKRVILYAREHRANREIHETLQKLVCFLQTQNIETFLDSSATTGFELNLPTITQDAIEPQHDLIIVVGGDGSLLSAARMAVQINVPVIGVNRGRLGFLTDISPQNVEEQLLAILTGKYQQEQRFLLTMTISDENGVIYFTNDALNDVVLSRGNGSYLIDFEIFINQQFVSHYRADGMIIATPTGSTAYALSAGGPIMHPQLEAIAIVPMFSHSLNSRPLVIDNSSEIQLHISHKNEQDLNVSCDGHEAYPVKPGQIVTIKQKSKKLQLLHPISYNYYDTLRIKLGWGSHHANVSKY